MPQHRLRGGLLLVVGAVIIGATITYGGSPAYDASLVRDAADLRDGWFGELMVWLSDVGYARWLIPVVLVWSLTLGLGFGRWRDALLVALATPIAAVMTRLLKESFERSRPVGYDELVAGFSMPSGHATSSAALVVSVVLATHAGPRRTALAVVGVAFAGLVALSRVVLGVHYPSDVVAGLCSGAGVALLVAYGVMRLPDRRTTA